MLLVLLVIMLITFIVIGIRRRQGQPVLIPSLILAVIVLVGVMTLIAYIQMFLLLVLALLGLFLALKSGNKPRQKE